MVKNYNFVSKDFDMVDKGAIQGFFGGHFLANTNKVICRTMSFLSFFLSFLEQFWPDDVIVIK